MEDLDAIPLIFNTKCFTQGLALGVDQVMESTSQSSFISSISRLHNGVLGLPFFSPLLLPPFSLHVFEVGKITSVGSNDVPFLNDLEANRNKTSPETTTIEVDWGARKLAIIVDFFSKLIVFFFFHYNMLLLAPPTTCLVGSLRMNGCQGWKLKELKLDETLENYVEEERLAITCF